MPISHKHRVIFIHIPKTAGTSIYAMLEIPNRFDPNAFLTLAVYNPCYQHLTPLQLKEKVEPSIWEGYYKFTVVRNPFDRLVSDYRYLTPFLWRQYNLTDFASFVHLVKRVVNSGDYTENIFFDHFRPQSRYLEGINYNYIARFETLRSDVEYLAKVFGVTPNIPWENKTSEVQGPANYRPFYTSEMRAIVEELYQEDLQSLNYSF